MRWAPVLQYAKNILTYRLKSLPYIGICISKDRKTQAVQVFIPQGVFLLMLRFKVLRAVQFDRQPGPCDIKIHNIRPQHLLAVGIERKAFQKIIP